MFSSPSAGKSVDSLAPLSPGGRADYPFHSRTGKPSSRRGSTSSSIHSVGGALHSSAHGQSAVYESGQNAISTLLQPPIVRTGLLPHVTAPASSTHKPPTAKDIPPVTLTNVPHVEADEFKPYLAQVGALYEQLRRVQETEDETTPANRSQKQPEEAVDSEDGFLRPSRSRPNRRGSTTSVSSLTSIDAPSPRRKSSISFNRKAAQGPAPLSTIPNVYFEEDFHLENPRTFDVVSERSEVIRPANADRDSNAPAPRKALATNAILQEKLSWYMDTIEVHLINSISTASTTFFTALGSLKGLHSEAAESVQRIKTLRQELSALDEEVASNGLRSVQKRRRQEHLRQLSDAVAQLRQVTDGLAACETLVDEGEVDKALESIDSLEKLIAGERQTDEDGIHLRDLRSTSALQGINTDLDTLRFRVGRAYEAQFQNILLADLRRHAESVSKRDVLARWGNAASRARGAHSRSPSLFPTYLAATEDLKAQLKPAMAGLLRAKHIETAAMAYKDAALREVRNLIRKPLPSSSEDDSMSMMSASTASGGRGMSGQQKSANLARNLRAMDAEDAEDLLITIYVTVTETLRRLSTQVKVLLDIATTLTVSSSGDGVKSPPVRSPVSSPRPERHASSPAMELQEELHKALDVANLLAQGVDIVNDKVVKVLKVRSEQAANLPLDLFLRYFTLNLYFANECEAISGRSGTSLKNVVNGHIKDFVQRNRDAEMQRLAQGMEADQWNVKDFNDMHSNILERILECSTKDAEDWASGANLATSAMELTRSKLESSKAETNGTEKEKARSAVIDSEKFLLPNSAILCMEGLEIFLHLISGIPSMTNDVASSLISYLQLFNSRCTQLILGAGATRSAGLKNITTKHLALASQALAFTATLIPHIREFVRRHAGSGPGVSSLMGEFDKVRRLLQEHQDSIHQKLVEIMSGRAALHSKSMKNISWDADKSDSAHAYMETLAKETTTLHRVLTKHLPESSLQVIMVPVFSSYKDQLGAALKGADPKTEAGQQSMLRDVDLFVSKLGKVDGFGDAGEYLTDIVKAKEVTPKEKPAPAAAEEPKQQPETSPEQESEQKQEATEPEKDDDAKGDESKDDEAKNEEIKDEDPKIEEGKDSSEVSDEKAGDEAETEAEAEAEAAPAEKEDDANAEKNDAASSS